MTTIFLSFIQWLVRDSGAECCLVVNMFYIMPCLQPLEPRRTWFKAFALAFLKFKAFALQVLGLCLCGVACRIQLHHSVPQPQFCIFFCRIILLSLIVAPVILYFPFISPSVTSLGCWWGNQLEGIIIPCVSLSFFVFLEGFCFSS